MSLSSQASSQGTASRPRSGCRKYAARLLLAAVGGGLGLAICEILLRLFSPGYSPLFVDIYRFDEHGQLAMKANIVRRHVTNAWRVTIATNDDGLRDRVTPVPDEGGTVLAVGDSYAFGWGVELAESFLYLAEESLRGERIRIVKAGIPGTGTSDQASWLQNHGDYYHPRAVLVALFVGNDFVDVQKGGTAGQFTIEDGLMIRRPVEGEPPSWLTRAGNKLKRSSLIAQKLAEFSYAHSHVPSDGKGIANPGLTAKDGWLKEYFGVHLRNPPEQTVSAFKLMEQALDSIHEWCRRRDIPLLLLVLPRSFQVYEWELAEWQKTFGWRDDQVDLDQPQRALAEWASARHVAMLDLLASLREEHRLHPGERLFFYPDTHLNRTGHRLVGQETAAFIRRGCPPGVVSTSRAS
jgi:hypothetical protein